MHGCSGTRILPTPTPAASLISEHITCVGRLMLEARDVIQWASLVGMGYGNGANLHDYTSCLLLGSSDC